ncbi:MAG: cyclase/dehydrase [Hyphomonadaceae bacterium]|nr:MAG: cyclase/dehydrase [Hyphomonadaceae bacterium]
MQVTILKNCGKIACQRKNDMNLRKIEIKEIVAFSLNQLMELVGDVANYPDFLPWVKAAKIWDMDEDKSSFSAQLLIGYKAFRATFSTKVTIDTQNQTVRTHLIEDGKSARGIFSRPLKSLDCKWAFSPNENGTEIHLVIELEFADMMLAKLVGNNLHKASARIMNAFIEEAKKRYH